MENVVLVIHLFLALAIIGLVLIQRSEGGGLGIGSGGGGLGRLTTAKGTANLLTRATAICGAGFFATSLLLGILAGYDSQARRGILDTLADQPPAQEAPISSVPSPEAPQPKPPIKAEENKTDTTPPDTKAKAPAAPIAE